jgi:diacylglycerol kinase family enzyme
MNANQAFEKILFVINPISGDVDKSELEEALAQYCLENKVQYQIYWTTGEDDLDKLRQVFQKDPAEAIFAAGGDGTVNLAAKLVNHTATPLGIIPVGSGNGLSKDLGIPQSIPEALTLIRAHNIKPIDTLELNNIPCFHLSDLGFNALVVARYSENDGRGPQAYLKVALQEYLSYQCHQYKIETDQETFEGDAFMITITNSNAFGSNVKINPQGIMDDGIFEICLIESFPKLAALQIMYDLYTEAINESEFTRVLPCRYATIYNYTDTFAQIDGEVVELGHRIEIKQHPQSLRIVVPVLTGDQL